MKKNLLYLGVLLLLFSCSQQPRETDPVTFENEFYAVLNTLIKSKFNDVSVVLEQTTPVHKKEDIFKTPPDDPSTPPPLDVYYDVYDFDLQSESIDSWQSKKMYDSIDTTRIISIDSSKINRPTLTLNQFLRIFSTKNRSNPFEGYDAIIKSFNGSCIARIFTPVFNSNYTVVFISINYGCGPLDGAGYDFILVKKNQKWRITKVGERWAS